MIASRLMCPPDEGTDVKWRFRCEEARGASTQLAGVAA